MKNIINVVFLLNFALSSFSNVFATDGININPNKKEPAEAEIPAKFAELEKGILGIFLIAVQEFHFDQIIEFVDDLSDQEKIYYKNEYRKIKAQYKVTRAQQKAAEKIQNKLEDMSEEELKKVEAKLKLKKAKAEANRELKKLKVEKKIKDSKNSERVK